MKAKDKIMGNKEDIKNFQGFGEGEVGKFLGELLIRVKELEGRVKSMEDEKAAEKGKQSTVRPMPKPIGHAVIEKIEKENKEYRDRAEKEIRKLREENESLMKKFESSKDKTEKIVEEISEMKNVWGNKVTETEVSLKEVIKEQKELQGASLGQKVVKVLRQNEKQVNEIVERKKCIVVFGDTEEDMTERNDRKLAEIRKVDEMISVLDDEEVGWRGEVEDSWRLGKYTRGQMRPIKIKFRSAKVAEDVLKSSWKLKRVQKYEKVIIRRDLNEEERQNMREISREVREKNEERTEEEKKNFYYRNINGKIKKWYTRGRESYTTAEGRQTREERPQVQEGQEEGAEG